MLFRQQTQQNEELQPDVTLKWGDFGTGIESQSATRAQAISYLRRPHPLVSLSINISFLKSIHRTIPF